MDLLEKLQTEVADYREKLYKTQIELACVRQDYEEVTKELDKFVLYGYISPSGKLYDSQLHAVQNGEQSFIKVYVNKEDLR